MAARGFLRILRQWWKNYTSGKHCLYLKRKDGATPENILPVKCLWWKMLPFVQSWPQPSLVRGCTAEDTGLASRGPEDELPEDAGTVSSLNSLFKFLTKSSAIMKHWNVYLDLISQRFWNSAGNEKLNLIQHRFLKAVTILLLQNLHWIFPPPPPPHPHPIPSSQLIVIYSTMYT